LTIAIPFSALNETNGSPIFVLASHLSVTSQCDLLKILEKEKFKIGECIQTILQGNEIIIWKGNIFQANPANYSNRSSYLLYWTMNIMPRQENTVEDIDYSAKIGISGYSPSPQNLLDKYTPGFHWTLTLNEFNKWYQQSSIFSKQKILKQIQAKHFVKWYTNI